MRLCTQNNKPITKVVQQEKMYMVSDGAKNFWMRAGVAKIAVKCHEIDNAKLHGTGICIITPQLKVERITQTNLEKLYLFMKYHIKYGKDYDYADNYSYQYFIKEYETDKKKCIKQFGGYVAFYGNKVVSWITVIKTLGLEVLISFYNDGNIRLRRAVINSIFAENPDTIMLGSLCNDCGADYNRMDKQSTIDPDYRYIFGYGEYLTKGRTDRFVKAIENKYFINKVDLAKVKLKVIEGKDLSKLWQSKYIDGGFEGYWINTCNIDSAVGFHYFHFNDAKIDARFILALYDGMIIGVIKLGVYYGDHQAIAYIDILRTCRNQGVATYMIKNIDKYLFKGLPLMITDESDMGKMCHIADKFKANVKSVKVKTYEEALRDGRYD